MAHARKHFAHRVQFRQYGWGSLESNNSVLMFFSKKKKRPSVLYFVFLDFFNFSYFAPNRVLVFFIFHVVSFFQLAFISFDYSSCFQFCICSHIFFCHVCLVFHVFIFFHMLLFFHLLHLFPHPFRLGLLVEQVFLLLVLLVLVLVLLPGQPFQDLATPMAPYTNPQLESVRPNA